MKMKKFNTNAILFYNLYFPTLQYNTNILFQVKDKILSGSFLPEPRFCPDGIYEVIKMCMNHDQHARPPFHIIYQELICVSCIFILFRNKA